MWCEPTPNGKVKFIERYEDPLTGKMKKVSVTMPKDTRMARKQAREAINDKIEQKTDKLLSYTKKDNLTLSELSELYLDYQADTVKKSTYRRNLYAIRGLIRLLGEETLAANLTAGYIKSRITSKSESPGTINERYKRLKAFLRWGYENDYITDVRYLDKIKMLPDKTKREKLQEKFLERQELQQLLEGMKIKDWRYLAEFTALSGLRCGEAIALEMKDIDFTTKSIHVNKTFDATNGVVTDPKTPCSNREVFMQPELEELCRTIRKRTLTKKMQYGCRTNLFMCDMNGEHLAYFTFNKYLKAVSKNILGRTVTTHVMRHTHTSLMAEAGVPLETISRRLGHENSRITREVYLHITSRQKEKDREIIKMVELL